MKACRVHRFGPPDVIEFEETPIPVPNDKEVLVRIEAAGVGPWDAWVRSGESVLNHTLPLTLGSDFSGTVAAVGNGATNLQVGQPVYGVTNAQFTGAYAEYAVATASMIAQKPHNLSHTEAASVPVVAVTALQMLFEHAHVKQGQRVLIHGAGGNVGAFAVMLSLAAGAYVIGTEMRMGVDYVSNLGAHEVIDTTAVPFEEVVAPVDVIIDTVGVEVQSSSFSLLKHGGVMVSSVSPPSPQLAAETGTRAIFMLVNVTTAALIRIAELIDAGKVTTRVGSLLPLSAARQAHEMLEGQLPHQPGKIVLTTGASA